MNREHPKMKEFSINGRLIGAGRRPYIIAEMSGNHNQSFEQAVKIVEAAARAGASAIKLQTFTADTVTLNCDKEDFYIDAEDSLWKGSSLFDLYESAYAEWDWISELAKIASDNNMDCFSSVFDESAVDFLENLGTCAYKIASFENNHIPLIRKVSSTKKPVIISTGMATEMEIEEIVENAREAGCQKLALLKCTSNYPADVADSNIASIPYLREKFNCEVGLSDHTLGIGVAVGSIALGATIIEKHFTTSRKIKSVDSEFSADEGEFTALVKEANRVSKAVGKPFLGITVNEEASLQFRRSIYAAKPIQTGEVFTTENIKIVRPGYGIHPRHYESLIGTICQKDFDFGDRIDESVLS